MSSKKEYLDEMMDTFINSNDEFREFLLEYQMDTVDCPDDSTGDAQFQFHMDMAEGDLLIAFAQRIMRLGLNIKREARNQFENAG